MRYILYLNKNVYYIDHFVDRNVSLGQTSAEKSFAYMHTTKKKLMSFSESKNNPIHFAHIHLKSTEKAVLDT